MIKVKYLVFEFYRTRTYIPHYPCDWHTYHLEVFVVAFHSCPTSLFTILGPQDQEIGEFYVAQARRTTDFETPKL